MTTKEDETRNKLDKSKEDEDSPDEWDQRIADTGCAAENTRLTDCYADNGRDWRKCVKEMQDLKKCWDLKKNDERTQLK
ncbi:uncharacterized protein V2V93DRAFT_375623 [Kockiozyma suomiensis]|uniref:uncharacterized protein n=1 Tax=Kockiozyma suomiensis TaxID=1337062 RepID=UPI003343379D